MLLIKVIVMKETNNTTRQQWYATGIQQILQELETDTKAGLTTDTATKRVEEYGVNELPKPKKQSKILRFLKHFNDVMIYILFAAAIVSAVLGHYIDTVVIVIVAVINAVIGFFQESKAEKALENIKNMLSLKANVIRDGQRKEIDANQVTIGDIVQLNPGDKVPADLRLLKTSNLKIEESMLTGESVPSEKNIDTLDEGIELGDRSNMAFSSTTVSSGTGTGVVIAIGKDTEIGKINQMLSEVNPITTPLLKQTSKFSKTISIAIVLIAGLVYLFGYFFRDYEPGELLMSVIGLAVAAIPEGLPAILSIILAIGVQNMARRNAIVRNLPSVETLGSVSVICSDKTGTLTKNEMTVKTLVTAETNYRVTGTGYAPEGQLCESGQEVDIDGDESVLRRLIYSFYYCNDAELREDNGNWAVNGDPTEGALITLFEKSELKVDEMERISTIPFDSEYKYMAVMADMGENNRFIFIKGAPDRMLEMACCEDHKDGRHELNRKFWEEKIAEIARKGQRMIGAAYKKVDSNKTEITHEDVQSDIVMLGLAGIIDPPRPEAIDAIQACHGAGITVKMITGDHADTAKSIGKEMGIGDGEKALQGKDLEKMDDKKFEEVVEEYDIFARTSPEHKLKLVTALQANGHVCAMTGDGVNDAPALKKADVGIAMGIKGTEVTKDSAEMVLVDDNFSTIVAAVEEGRRVYDNLKKTILFILPTNGAESFLIIASILFGTLMPLTPVQILWVNMVTSVTISFALAFEVAEPDSMKRKPRSPKAQLLNSYFVWRIIFVSVLIGGGTLLLNIFLLNQGMNDEEVRTITLQTIVITQMFHLYNSRSIRKFAFGKDFFTNKAVFVVSALLIVLQLSITYIPFMNTVFGIMPLPWYDWLYPIGMGLMVFILVEIEKAVMNKIGFARL